MVDISNLAAKLEDLTGVDFEECERDERTAGNNTVDVSLSKSFQARLAARALEVNPHDIKNLPLKKYAQVTLQVMTFLFGNLEKEETPASGSETRQ